MNISLERLNKVISHATKHGYTVIGIFTWGRVEYSTPVTLKEVGVLPTKVEVRYTYMYGDNQTYTTIDVVITETEINFRRDAYCPELEEYFLQSL